MKNVKFHHLAQCILPLVLIALVGCTPRSISNSGYPSGRGYYFGSGVGYHGELSELEVLGITANPNITEEDIRAALADDSKVALKRADRVVVQSGALFPDEPLLEELNKHYTVVPLSGIPHRQTNKEGETLPVDKSLRLASAKSNAKTMIVYWGVLETARANQGSKIISWVPIVGKAIPDQKQDMRIRLKAAIIDVETGAWEFVMPKVYSDSTFTARQSREQKDQSQVTRLKAKGYEALAKALTARYR
ncbi:MAG: aminopeptidase [Verrucomicrobiales bacterium]|nr:aminopeptidase [Verrucomicrobiales bacterium]|tara:strand:- start:1234 stop:1977 length:744 start_codon:yes stop_codon:yes gene_type:complete